MAFPLQHGQLRAAPPQQTVELLSLFFIQYQSFPRFPGERQLYKKEETAKGKEKLVEEEEEEEKEEEESGEEGLLLFSEDERQQQNEEGHTPDEDEGMQDYGNDDDDVEEKHMEYEPPSWWYEAGEDEEEFQDMVEDEEELGWQEEAECWERRLVSPKLGGHVVRRHSRGCKKPRHRPHQWVSARLDRKHPPEPTDYSRHRCAVTVFPSASASASSILTTGATTNESRRRQNAHPSAVVSEKPRKEKHVSTQVAQETLPVYEREMQRAIDRGNVVQCGLTSQQLNDLLNRDLTPEDYELLLMLDSTVSPKTLSASRIDSFASHSLDAGSSWWRDREGEHCTVCMCSFEVGEVIKELPLCRHCFHSECIAQWLSTASTKCPLCGASLD
jgi:hypothetical protein